MACPKRSAAITTTGSGGREDGPEKRLSLSIFPFPGTVTRLRACGRWLSFAPGTACRMSAASQSVSAGISRFLLSRSGQQRRHTVKHRYRGVGHASSAHAELRAHRRARHRASPRLAHQPDGAVRAYPGCRSSGRCVRDHTASEREVSGARISLSGGCPRVTPGRMGRAFLLGTSSRRGR